MVRIGAIFIALCMVLIAASIGIVLYLRFGFTPADAALVALGVLTALAIYNAVAGRKSDRAEVSDQVSSLARGSGDIARQVAEFGRRLSVVETEVEIALDKAHVDGAAAGRRDRRAFAAGQATGGIRGAARPRAGRRRRTLTIIARKPAPPTATVTLASGVRLRAGRSGGRKVAAFSGLDRDGIIALVRSAIEAQQIDLYLQPIVTLAAAQGSLLRGDVAAQCRQRRTRRRPRISFPMPKPAR